MAENGTPANPKSWYKKNIILAALVVSILIVLPIFLFHILSSGNDDTVPDTANTGPTSANKATEPISAKKTTDSVTTPACAPEQFWNGSACQVLTQCATGERTLTEPTEVSDRACECTDGHFRNGTVCQKVDDECVPSAEYETTNHAGYKMTKDGCVASGCQDGYAKDGGHKCVATSARCDKAQNVVQCGNKDNDACDTNNKCCNTFEPKQICCELYQEAEPASFHGKVGTQLRYCNNVGNEADLQAWLVNNGLSATETDPARRICPPNMKRVDPCPPKGQLQHP